MTGYEEAKKLFEQSVTLLRAEKESTKLPASMEPVLHFLLKGLVRLTESLEADLKEIKKTTAGLRPPSK
jgi:hypothetical protein